MDIVRRDFKEPDRKAAQEQIIREVTANPQHFLLQYRKDLRTFGGRYVNSDLMKETFPLYRTSRESRNYYNLPVHNAAAALAAMQFSAVVQDRRNPEQIVMHFVTGTPGSGKTTVIQEHGILPHTVRGVYEGQLVDGSAFFKIREALDAGLVPRISVVHTKPETALDNIINRFTLIGRGGSIALIAKILGDLPEGLHRIHESFGDVVTLDIFDKRDQFHVKILEGWEHLHVLQSEGTRERIKTRLSEYLETIRGKLAPDCYDQAAGLPPVFRRGDKAEPSRMAGESGGQ
ncbi:MAG: hypothetical protein LBC79_03960 [Deltaproteobacteria bacterium]|jgi:hypothetical protein|nr:hypothetical protein [Deltaproteobacteria bacterium]